ncbi:MAG: AmmeMemoRadiSam system radical SAM enzyme [Thermoplasmata archaeon]
MNSPSDTSDEMHEALFWQSHDVGSCIENKENKKDEKGKTSLNKVICLARKNIGGKLYSLIYGKASSVHPDPVEKKPLYHFHPGEDIMSFGTLGCNLKCKHCQNHEISQRSPDEFYTFDISPEDVVDACRKAKCRLVAFTYNEPTIWYEFVRDASQLCKIEGVKTVWVTNGFINEEPLRQVLPLLDAANVDVKAFTEEFYKNVSKARLEPVKKTCKILLQAGKHIELTYLIIPGYNDSEKEIREFCRWVKSELNEDVPVHFSRFHPDYQMTDVAPTPASTLKMAYDISHQEGLSYVYVGNIRTDYGEDTLCKKCKNVLISRSGYSIRKKGMNGNLCSRCSTPVPFVM